MSRIAAPQEAQQAGRVPCAADAERMFPLEESVRADQAPTVGERRALRLCSACRVQTACRTVVLGMELPYGVAGGMTAAQRLSLIHI